MSDSRFHKPLFRCGEKSDYVRISIHKNGDCQPYNIGTYEAGDFYAYFNAVSRLYLDLFEYDYITVQPVLEKELNGEKIVY